MDVRPSSLPWQGRWHGGAVTERSQQICGNLSVSFADSAPFRGALDFRSPQGGTNRVQALFSPLSFLLREKR